MKKVMIALLLCGVFFLLVSCDFSFTGPMILDCPESIVARVYEYALKYKDADTEYKWGGQDPLRAIQVDCSGLVIRCYQYALEGTGFSLLQPDMSSAYMYENAATLVPLEQLRPGDLIFMGEKNSANITHIAIFSRAEGNTIYFIDSTEKSAEGKAPSVNGVTERSYSRNDKRFKSGGIMQLKH
ncbi:MAG: C40 family peptidase [Treponema sp.]|nr:C40 family peptidase [Treponema sp.]